MTNLGRNDPVLLDMSAGWENDARAFYQGMLGIPEVVNPPQLAARGGCWFEAGELKVHLGAQRDFVPATKAHPAVIVDDLADLLSNIKHAASPLYHGALLRGHTLIVVRVTVRND